MQITKSSYNALKREIDAEIERGKESIHAAYKREVLITHWNIGCRISQRLHLSEAPSKANASVIRSLSKDFKRPDTFFYAVIKFYREYPECPRTDLSWSHYTLLLSVKDTRKRNELEKRALKENINAKDFRSLVRVPEQNPLGRVLTFQSGVLEENPGKLYHYRVRDAYKEPTLSEEVTLDIGFGIDRKVKLPRRVRIASGRILHVKKDDTGYSVKIARPDPALLYTYKGEIVRVIDGDTVIAKIDLGFRTWIETKLRLRGIDAPEATSARGLKAKLFLEKIIPKASEIIVKTYKDDKYGRFLADIHFRSLGTDLRKLRSGCGSLGTNLRKLRSGYGSLGTDLRKLPSGYGKRPETIDYRPETKKKKVSSRASHLDGHLFLNQLLLDKELAVLYG